MNAGLERRYDADPVHRLALVLAITACDSPPLPGPEMRSEDARAVVDARRGDTPGVLEFHEADSLSAEHGGRRVQAHGFVRPGSIARNPTTGVVRFAIGSSEPPLVVEFTGVLPERFQEELEVIVTGTVGSDGRTIASDELVAKCPENYDEAPRP